MSTSFTVLNAWVWKVTGEQLKFFLHLKVMRSPGSVFPKNGAATPQSTIALTGWAAARSNVFRSLSALDFC